MPAREFALEAPIKEQLQAILLDYPGGQLLSEALQNAEDSGATAFELTLDLRRHDAVGDDRLSAPAFVLADNGRGFTDREWKSLRTLHRSEKSDSPRDIGRFGMGSRSYFHYADTILVVSNGEYVGLDPLCTVCSAGRKGKPGWAYTIDDPDSKDDRVYDTEVNELFHELLLPSAAGTGAAFRLPLRREKEVAAGLGPAMLGDAAMNLLDDWAKSLLGGRLLLFLSTVARVSVRRWDDGEPMPVVIAEMTKRPTDPRGKGSPFARMPAAVPEDAAATFTTLNEHLSKLSEAESAKLSQRHTETVTINVGGTNVPSTNTVWRVVQRFDATNAHLREQMADCTAIPVIGVAIPVLDSAVDTEPAEGGAECKAGDSAHRVTVDDKVETNIKGGSDGNMSEPDDGAAQPTQPDAASVEDGGVFCFLPVGAMQTGLPVHLNASFQVTKDRRSLWRSAGDLDGRHKAWAKWNEVLLNEAIPELVVDALADMAAETSPRAATALVRCLPDLDRVERSWQQCAIAIYRRATTVAVIPYVYGGTAEWITPQSATVLDVAPTDALAALQDDLMAMYAETAPAWGNVQVVDLPAHVAKACREHCGVRDVTTADLIDKLLDSVRPVHRLTPALLALAELADQHRLNDVDRWGKRLSNLAWVPLKATAGKVANPFVPAGNAFAANVKHLHDANLMVVATATADVDSEAELRTLKRWGLKQELKWDDALIEAKQITSTDIDHATRFMLYLDTNADSMGKDSRVASLKKLGEYAVVPGWGKSSLPDEKPQPALFRAADVCAKDDQPVVWTTLPTAQHVFRKLPWAGLAMRSVTAADLATQIETIAAWTIDAEGGPRWSATEAEPYLRKAVDALLRQHDTDMRVNALERLRSVAWIPSFFDDDTLRLLEPKRVTRKWDHNLLPCFGLWDRWRRTVSLRKEDADAAGVAHRLPATVLVKALAEIAAECAKLTPEKTQLAVNLALELCAVTHDDRPSWEKLVAAKYPEGVHVPTLCGQLEVASKVFVNDAPFCTSAEKKPFVLHDGIGPGPAARLGCRSIRDELARASEADDGEAFGQFEDLPDRIRGLLGEYDDKFDVFTEHWQNSDDAGADALCFLLDLSKYGTERLVNQSKGCLELQGPALVLASSKALTTDDIRRIRQIGASKKRGQFAQAGHFGVGLSCLYKIADCPTLLANGSLHIFDPLCIAVADGGKKYRVDLLRANQMDHMLEPFGHPELEEFATIFRLPLRPVSHSQDSFAAPVNQANLETTLRQFTERIPELLLLSKAVRRATFAVRRPDGRVDVVANAELRPTDPAAAELVMARLPSTITEVRALKKQQVDNVTITMKVGKDDRGNSVVQRDERWVIAHSLEATTELVKLVNQQFKKGVAMLPHGAAAVRLNGDAEASGHVCSYMPIAGMQLGAPLVLHGCFRVASNRKSVPCSGEDTKHDWNQALLRGPVASSLALLAETCRAHVDNGVMPIEVWFSLLELGNTAATSELRGIVWAAMLRKLHSKQVFPVLLRGNTAGEPTVLRWQDGPSAVLRVPDNALPSPVQDRLVAAGLRLVELPVSIAEGLHGVGLELPRMDPGRLCAFLQNVSTDAISDEDAAAIVKFVLGPRQESDADVNHQVVAPLHGTPLLLLADESRGCFGTTECFWDHAALLPHAPKYFVHESIRTIFVDVFGNRPTNLSDAVGAAGIKHFTAKELLPHHHSVHEEECYTDKEWRHRVLDLCLYGVAKVEDGLRKMLDDFGKWKLIEVTTPKGDTECIRLDDLPTTFSLERIDQDFRQEIGEVVLECGVCVLHAAELDVARPLLEHAVGSTDNDLIQIIAGMHKSLRTKHITHLLSYFSSKCGKGKLSPTDLENVRRLPLFLSGVNGQGYCAMDDGETTYVCLHDDTNNRLKELKALELNRKVRFLAVPPRGCSLLFEELGVQILTAVDFVVDYVCEALEPVAAAEADQHSQSTTRRLSALLDELTVWLELRCHRERVAEEAREQCFVLTAGNTLSLPDKLVDPAHPLVNVFSAEAAAWIPHPRRQPHIKLLQYLGLRDHPNDNEIAKIARVMDAVAGNCKPEAITAARPQAFQLVEEVCRQVINLDNGIDDAPKIIEAVAEHRIAFVRPAGRDAIAASLGIQSPPPKPILAPFRALVLTPECAELVGFKYPVLERSLGKPRELNLTKTHLHEVINSHAQTMHNLLGCLCQTSHVPLADLLEHIGLVADTVVEAQDGLDFSRGGKVYTHLQKLLGAIDQAVADRSDTDLTAAEQKSLADLRLLPCIPIATLADAAGELPDNMFAVRVVKPCQCFLMLSPKAQKLSALPLFEYADFTKWQNLAKHLEVRSSPEATDWARCSRVFADHTRDAGAYYAAADDGRDDTVATENESAAIAYAIKELLLGAKDTDTDLDVWLPDSTGHIVRAADLVWPDYPEFAERCSGVRLVDTDVLDLNPSERRKLCDVCALSKLSNFVVEELAVSEPVEPTEYEMCLEALLQSDEFAEGYARLARASNGKGPQACELELVVQQIMARLDVQWSTKIHTHLQSKDGAESTDSKPSSTSKKAFVDGEGRLWLQSGLLGTDADNNDLLSDLGGRVLPETILAKVGAVRNTHVVPRMLQCWSTNGPAGIPAVLAKENVADIRNRQRVRNRPGMVIPPESQDTVRWSPRTPLQPGEAVAVLVDPNDDSVFKFAKVERDQQSARTRANLEPASGDGLWITRTYMLNVGETVPVERKRLDIWVISRKPPPLLSQSAASAGGDLVAMDSATAAGDVPESITTTEWNDLVEQLQQMVRLSSSDYRRVLKQLWLQWHPDKNSRPCAAAVFRLLQRHETTFKSDDQDFGWLDDIAGPETLEDSARLAPADSRSATAADPTTTSTESEANVCQPNQPSYFAEFEREEAEHSARERQRQARADVAHNAWRAGGSAGEAADTEPRVQNDAMADLYWQLAERELKASAVLASATMWAPAIVHAQQAAELTIKSLMFRTCGITDTELKGKGAHDLPQLLGRLKFPKPCPAEPHKVHELSIAYIQARYSDRALAGYVEADATAARETAAAVVGWAKLIDWVPKPGVVDSDPADTPLRATRQVVLDPTPPPCTPQQTLPLESPAAAAVVAPSTVVPPIAVAAAVHRVELADPPLALD
eukprot:m.84631 g.84631  ORF g.84631 m.84631 type:complete len:3122 (+) comp9602_c0_seq1:196-9561(+)